MWGESGEDLGKCGENQCEDVGNTKKHGHFE